MAVWSGDEQKGFEAVLAGFKKANPGVSVKYTSAGDQLPTVLSTAVTGGNPPDIAALPQPGLMKDFVNKGALKPIAFASKTIGANYAPVWKTLGTVNGKLYGLFFKGGQQVDRLLQRQVVQGRRRQVAEDLAAAARGRQDAARVGHSRILDRRCRRVDAHRPVREHLSPDSGARQVRQADEPQDQVDGRIREEGARRDGRHPR